MLLRLRFETVQKAEEAWHRLNYDLDNRTELAWSGDTVTTTAKRKTVMRILPTYLTRGMVIERVDQ